MRDRTTWAIAGGCAFWLPFVSVSYLLRWKADPVVLNSASLTGITLLGVYSQLRLAGKVQWGWMLAGIWILGGAAMSWGGELMRFPHARDSASEWFWGILITSIPTNTLVFSLENGMFISILLVTVLLPILSDRSRRSRSRTA